LGVAKLIEGSIFRVDNRVRITVQLVDARLDEHIWSETFEREVEDVMMLQNEVARAIAHQVEVTLKPEEQNQLGSAESINPAAYDAYLKGNFHVERFTPQDIKLAAQYYQQAVELDPDNALAYAGLAKLCAFQAQMGLIRPQVARERCLPSIEKALELDDSLPDAQLAYAVHMTWLWYNWEEGNAAFQRAIELNPSFAEARMFYSHFLTLTGRIEEGTEQMRLALELDPLNPFVRALHGVQLYMADDLQGCVRVIEEVLASTPGFGFGYWNLLSAYHYLGEKDKAIAASANVHRIYNEPELALALETAYAESGYVGAMLSDAQALEELSKTVHVEPLAIGELYEYAGEVEKAIDWFELGYQITGPGVPYLGAMTKSPAIQSNPRFIKLLRDIKLDYWADKYSQAGE
jgi:tetratricopeptide (TPR) repeat protein